MGKVPGILAGLAVALGVIPYALSIEAPTVPPGILASNWIPMGDAAGFVMTNTGNDFRKGLRNEPNVAKGYFMARHGNTWFRVDSTADYEAHPAVCPNESPFPLYGI